MGLQLRECVYLDNVLNEYQQHVKINCSQKYREYLIWKPLDQYKIKCFLENFTNYNSVGIIVNEDERALYKMLNITMDDSFIQTKDDETIYNDEDSMMDKGISMLMSIDKKKFCNIDMTKNMNIKEKKKKENEKLNVVKHISSKKNNNCGKLPRHPGDEECCYFSDDD